MHRARVERVVRDLRNCTVEDFMGIAVLLHEQSKPCANNIPRSLGNAIEAVQGDQHMQHQVMGLLYSKELWLLDSGNKKIQVIKVVRAVTSVSLKEAKNVVDTAPCKIVLSAGMDATAAARALEEVGAIVELRGNRQG